MLAYETDASSTVDPFAGSYAVESMTDAMEAEVLTLMGKVADFGGAIAAIEVGFQKDEIERSAYQTALQIDSHERTVVGVNAFTVDDEEPYQPMRVNPEIEAQQCDVLVQLRSQRDNSAVRIALDGLRHAAAGSGAEHNCLPHIKAALAASATGGEVADALRDVWGTYRPSERM